MRLKAMAFAILAATTMTAGVATVEAAVRPLQLAPVAQSLVPVSDNGNCSWFAITVCSRNWQGAQTGVDNYGGEVIDTNDVDGFRPGWFCAVYRGYDKADAEDFENQARRRGATTAYVKHGCE
ncbi:MAG: hypothetical protein GC150_01260 [Rhizobiales bacterium]|nr:hypothetical protein [Hyphomicrobiales bacterium]